MPTIDPNVLPLADAYATYEADTHLQIHEENNVLFPAVIAEEMRRKMQ